MHARWYTPKTGTFNTRDDWTLHPDPSIQANRYTYANADPANNTDPSGHLLCGPLAPVCAVAVGGAAAATAPAWPYLLAAGVVAGAAAGVGYYAYQKFHPGYLPSGGGPTVSPCVFFRCNPSGPYPPYAGAGAGSGSATATGYQIGGGWGGGPGTWFVRPPRPSPAELQAKLVDTVLKTPKPRPALKPGGNTKLIEKTFEDAERAVKTVAAVSNGQDIIDQTDDAFKSAEARPDETPSPANIGGEPDQVPCRVYDVSIGEWKKYCGLDENRANGTRPFVGPVPAKRPKLLSSKELSRIGFRYQKFVTGQNYEEVWSFNGRQVQPDGGLAGNGGYTVESKWTGNEYQWASSPYNPSNYFDERGQVAQARKLLGLNAALGGKGVRYAVSNKEGAWFYRALFREWFPDEMASGALSVWHSPGNGMK